MTATTSTRGKVVVVTGASSGIGAATASTLAAAGHHVVLGARRRERLDTLVASLRASGHNADAENLDVTDSAAVQDVVDRTVQRLGRVDVIVNNAGLMPLSRLDALLIDQWDQMIDVNVRGLLHGIAAVLPHFRRQGSGHVVTVASIGAHEVSPTAAVYCATKYAAWAITEGLRHEADPSIRVTTVSPGVVDTELADTITDPDAAAAMTQYRAASIRPEVIADAITYAINQPDDVDVNEIIVRPTRQR